MPSLSIGKNTGVNCTHGLVQYSPEQQQILLYIPIPGIDISLEFISATSEELHYLSNPLLVAKGIFLYFIYLFIFCLLFIVFVFAFFVFNSHVSFCFIGFVFSFIVFFFALTIKDAYAYDLSASANYTFIVALFSDDQSNGVLQVISPFISFRFFLHSYEKLDSNKSRWWSSSGQHNNS
jgi:hypothetical protein